jgi:hypothetical protein
MCLISSSIPDFLGTLRAESLKQVQQAVLSWLPGYMYSNGTLQTTGGAIPPTFHLREDGEIMCYVRPIFEDGPTVGLFLKMSGIKDAVERGIH